MTALTISWPVVLGVVAFAATIAPGFYHLGRLSREVQRNSNDIQTIFSEVKSIGEYVRNGK